MTTELTENQKREIVRIEDHYRSVGFCTEPADWKKAEENISKLYARINEKTPLFVHVSSPNEANILISFLSMDENMQKKEDSDYIDSCIDNGEKIDFSKIDQSTFVVVNHKTKYETLSDVPWVASYKSYFSFIDLSKLEQSDKELFETWDNIIHSCFSWYPFKLICIISDRPCELHVDENYKTVDENGQPAIRFRDGFVAYANTKLEN